MKKNEMVAWCSHNVRQMYLDQIDDIKQVLKKTANINLLFLKDDVTSRVSRMSLVTPSNDTVLVLFSEDDKKDGQDLYEAALYDKDYFYTVPSLEEDNGKKFAEIIYGLLNPNLISLEEVEAIFDENAVVDDETDTTWSRVKRNTDLSEALESFHALTSESSKTGRSTLTHSIEVKKIINSKDQKIKELEGQIESLKKDKGDLSLRLEDNQQTIESLLYISEKAEAVLADNEELQAKVTKFENVAEKDYARFLDQLEKEAEDLRSINDAYLEQIRQLEQAKNSASSKVREYERQAYLPKKDLSQPIPRVLVNGTTVSDIRFDNIIFVGAGEPSSVIDVYNFIRQDILEYDYDSDSYGLAKPLFVDFSATSNADYRFNCKTPRGAASWLFEEGSTLTNGVTLATPQGKKDYGLSVYAPAEDEETGYLNTFEMFSVDWIGKLGYLNSLVEDGHHSHVVVYLGDLTTPFGASMMRDLIDGGNSINIYILGSSQISLHMLESLTKKIVKDSGIEEVNKRPSGMTSKEYRESFINNYDSPDDGISTVIVESILPDATEDGKLVRGIAKTRDYLQRYYVMRYLDKEKS